MPNEKFTGLKKKTILSNASITIYLILVCLSFCIEKKLANLLFFLYKIQVTGELVNKDGGKVEEMSSTEINN